MKEMKQVIRLSEGYVDNGVVPKLSGEGQRRGTSWSECQILTLTVGWGAQPRAIEIGLANWGTFAPQTD